MEIAPRVHTKTGRRELDCKTRLSSGDESWRGLPTSIHGMDIGRNLYRNSFIY